MLRQILIVVVFVGFVAAGLYLLGARREAPTDAQPPPVNPQPVAQPTLSGPIQAATTEYELVKTELQDALEEYADEADAEFIEPVTEDLGFLDRAVMEITLALAENPENQSLQEMLLNMYDEQIGLLRKALSLVSGEPE